MKRLLLIFSLLAILPSAICFAGDYEDGWAAVDRGDYATALKKWRPMADMGFPEVQFSMGALYERGQGVPQDFKQAFIWYRKAAEKEYAAAQHNLGVLYFNGHGAPQDYKEAARWFSKAAEQGYAAAQFSLGLLYGRGEGVPRNFVLAHKWFSLAAKNGYQAAIEHRDAAEAFLTLPQLEEAHRLAKEWTAKRK